MKKIMVITAMFFLATALSYAQGLPPIYDNTAKDIYQTKKFVVYPKNTWLENIVKGNDGAFYLTNYPAGKILKVTADGKQEDYAQIKGKVAGIATYNANEFLVVGWDTLGKPSVFLVDGKKNTSLFVHIKGGMFPNGIIKFENFFYLIADSYAGCIWLLNTTDKSITIWSKNDLLARFTEKDELPAANGLKIYKSNLYVSNTEKQIIVKIPIIKNTAGTPEKYIEKVSADDFAFDNAGNIYAAANVYNRVIKITPGKKVTVIAELQNGTAGVTSVLIDKNKSGKNVLYVPTCGGMGMPPASGIEEGKILEIQIK